MTIPHPEKGGTYPLQARGLSVQSPSRTPLPELPEEYRAYGEDLLPGFRSGVGDLDDLEVYFPLLESETTDYQVVGTRFSPEATETVYEPIEVAIDTWATARIPWNQFTQPFKYRVDAFPKAEFGYKVTGTIRITSFSYTWKLLITYRLLDKDEELEDDEGIENGGETDNPEILEEESGEDPEDENIERLILEDESVPASISESEALPKLLFEETLTERAHSALQAEGYEQDEYEILDIEVIPDTSMVNITIDEDGHVMADLVNNVYQASFVQEEEVIYGYESPKILNHDLEDLIAEMTNEYGEGIRDAYMLISEPEVEQLYEVESFNPNVAVRFTATGETTSTESTTLIEAVYDEVIQGAESSGVVVYPNQVTIPNPLSYQGEARYRVEITENSANVAAYFVDESGDPQSSDTTTVEGAITDDPSHQIAFFVTRSDEGATYWESIRRRISAIVNLTGDLQPVEIPVSPSVLQVPENAVDIIFHMRLSHARAVDSGDASDHVSAVFVSTGKTTTITYATIDEAAQASPIIRIEGFLSRQRSLSRPIDEIIYSGTGSVAAHGESVLGEFSVPSGDWTSFKVNVLSENVIARVERLGNILRVVGRVAVNQGRWRPEVKPGTYYHKQLEYIKFKRPAFFTIRGGEHRTLDGYALVNIEGIHNGVKKAFGQLKVSAPMSDWGVPYKRLTLEEMVRIATGLNDIEGLELKKIDGRLDVGLNEQGFIFTDGERIEEARGVFKQRENGVVLPVTLPLLGPVLAWDTYYPSRRFIRLDDWAREGFQKTVELKGNGHQMVSLPVPYSTVISCFENGVDITQEVDSLGSALVRKSGLFEISKTYKVTLRAREAFGLIGGGPDLRLAFSENAPSITVACEQEGSYPSSERPEVRIPYRDPETGQTWEESWVPETEHITLFPFDNPLDTGFIVVSQEKRRPAHIRLWVEPGHIIPGQSGMPLSVICEVTDERDNPVGGESVRITAPWLGDHWYVRTDIYGFARLAISAPTNPGTYSVSAHVRQIGAEYEVIVS